MLPNIYFFNPTCEPAIANGSPYYTAPARLRKFEADLGYLPVWLAEEGDQVLVQGKVDEAFHSSMKNLGFRLPEVINFDEALTDVDWVSRPRGSLIPWGWSPAVYQIFKPVMPSFCDDFLRSPVASWQSSHRNLYSRLSGIDLLDKITDEINLPWLTEKSSLPVVCTTLEAIWLEVGLHVKSVVKTPWSSSGRGLLLFPNPDLKKKNEEVLSGMLSQQGFVTVEPWMDKLTDLSFQFYFHEGIIAYKGRTIFETDSKGRYVRNFLTDSPLIPSEVSRFLENHCQQVVDLLMSKLAQSSYASSYEGWIGVDAMVYKTENELLKFHPVVEVNGRFTMGALALKIRDYLAPGSGGFMTIYYSKSSNFQVFAQKQAVEKPLIMQDQKIVSGFLPLTPPSPEHSFGAYVEVITN